MAEVSPYAVDLDWSDLDDPEEIAAVVADLGRATATMHAAADDESGHSLVPFSTERAIDAAIAADEDGFGELLVEFAHGYGARARADHQIFVDLFRNGRLGPAEHPVYGRVRGGRRLLRGRLQGRHGTLGDDGHIRDAAQGAAGSAVHGTGRDAVRGLPCAAVPGPAAAARRRRAQRRGVRRRVRAGGPGAGLLADRGPARPAGTGRGHRLHHRPARLLRPGGRPRRRVRCARSASTSCAAAASAPQLPGVASPEGAAAALLNSPDPALPWLLLAAHVSVGLLAAAWLRRGESALAAPGADARPVSRSGRCCSRSPWRARSAGPYGARARPAGRPRLSRTRLLVHSVGRRGPPRPRAQLCLSPARLLAHPSSRTLSTSSHGVKPP